jgi:peptidyl-prolyl cis-trans isomerase SDCCAG10
LQTEKSSTEKDDNQIKGLREKHAKERASKLSVHDRLLAVHFHACFHIYRTARQMEIDKMEAEIRKLSKRTGGGVRDDSDDDNPSKKKAKTRSYLEEELSKYSRGRLFSSVSLKDKDGKKKRDETDVLAALSNFRGMLQGSDAGIGGVDNLPDDADNEDKDLVDSQAGLEVDTDQGFLSHLLHFPKDNTEEVVKAERDYEVIDPRQRGARAKQEERDRKNAAAKGRGRHRR